MNVRFTQNSVISLKFSKFSMQKVNLKLFQFYSKFKLLRFDSENGFSGFGNLLEYFAKKIKFQENYLM